MDTVQDTNFDEALGERYLAYALSTITSRSLPDVRDGLKPVHRRLLYAMRQLKLDPSTGFKKCARVVGDVIGKYHPHGDQAVYDAMVRLAQEFAQRYPLVDGQGNFGNIDGDNAAAMRYTEARMTEVALLLLDGIGADAVDFRDTYDGGEDEPVVLPAGFPNLLANGATGIAVGMATFIPPHNAVEICDALIHLIKSPNATMEKLVDLIPGPDFPTGGELVEPRDSIVQAYGSGKGGFRLRARWKVEKLSRGLYQVVVSEIPYQVQKARLIEKIAELLAVRKLPWLADIRDESAENVRIVLEPKSRTVDAAGLMEQMFRQTDLEVRIGLNLNVLDKGKTPVVMNLRQALQAYLDHRHQVLVRVNEHRLGKIKGRLEVLDGLLIAYLNLDEVIRIVREDDDPRTRLMKNFKLSPVQADAVLNMRLRQLRKLVELEIWTENKALKVEKNGIDTLLKDESLRWKTVRSEIAGIKKRFGAKTELGRRRTKIGKAPTPLEAETMVEREPITVLCSEKGWIRAVKGHPTPEAEPKYKEGDRGRFTLPAQSSDKLVIFATNGRFYTLACDKLAQGRSHGEPLRLMIELTNGYDVAAMFIHSPGRKLLVASSSGRGFVVEEDAVIAQTRNGKQVLTLSDGEEAAACSAVGEKDDAVAVVGSNRKLLVFPLAALPALGRGRGVIVQRYGMGGLSDAKTIVKASGLTWRSGKGTRTETNLKPWFGKRAQAGKNVPKGFPRSNRFK